jgi:hypothetical protein
VNIIIALPFGHLYFFSKNYSSISEKRLAFIIIKWINKRNKISSISSRSKRKTESILRMVSFGLDEIRFNNYEERCTDYWKKLIAIKFKCHDFMIMLKKGEINSSFLLNFLNRALILSPFFVKINPTRV